MGQRVTLADGRTFNVAIDDREAAIAAAQRYAAANPRPRAAANGRALPNPPPSKRRREERGALGTAVDFAGDMLDNAAPNLGDEWAGLWGGIGSAVLGNEGGFQGGYDRQSGAFRERQERYDEEHPNLAWGSTIAGTVTGAALPAGKVASAATRVQRARQGAAVGAAYGAAAGAGEGDTLDERLTNGAYGMAMGAGTGGVLPSAIDLGAYGARTARRYVPGADALARTIGAIPEAISSRLGASASRGAGTEQADRMLAQQMRQGNISDGFGRPGAASSPMTIAREVERRNQAGVPAMIGDVSDNMRGLTEYASRGMGPGQSMVRRALDERKAREALRVRQHVQGSFPTVDDPVRYVADVQREAREAAGPLYDQAYSRPMYRTAGIQGLEETPAFQESLLQAFRNIQNQLDPATGRPKSPWEMGFRWFDGDPTGLPPNVPHFPHPSGRGFVAVDKGLSVEGYDQVARAMQGNSRRAANVNPVTGRIENTSDSVHIGQRAGDLRRELMDQNPAYAQAVTGYGDDMTFANAFEHGQGVDRLTGAEVTDQVRGLPDRARAAWATGAGTAMADAAAQHGARHPTGSTADRVRQMLGDEAKQQAVGDVRGDPAAVRQLLDRLEYEQQAHLNWQGVNGNSRTAQRQQLDEDLDTAFGLPTSKAAAVGRLVNWMAGKANPRYHREVRERIAEVVTASGAQDVQTALRAIEGQLERDRSFRNVLHRSGIATTALYGANVQPLQETDDGREGW